MLVHIEHSPKGLNTDQIQEFKDLATSAGAQVYDLVTGTRARPDPKFYAGTGKIEEIAEIVSSQDIELVLFNQRLSPSQERNIEARLSCRVLDRTGLILDIFAQRASTFEGKLQVELAQLVHLSTRLVRGWTHLERQKGGIGLRGPGETQLETDRRLLSVRVKTIQRRLGKVRKQRAQGRQARTRSEIPGLSLVGYTNAGKSTLFNSLTGHAVYAADKLFATLDPTFRKFPLAGGRDAILIDTVGFISDLPHELVDAFRSTLLETREARLLLHIVDAADDLRSQRIDDVDEVLKSIDADKIPTLMVYNKIDKSGVDPHIDRDDSGKPVRVWVSAQNELGLDLLAEAVVELIDNERVHGLLTVEPAAGALRAKLYELSAVINETCDEKGAIVLEIDLDRVNWQRLCDKYTLNEDSLET